MTMVEEPQAFNADEEGAIIADVLDLLEEKGLGSAANLVRHLEQVQDELNDSKELRKGVTAVVIAHPARLSNGLLTRALQSITEQTRQPDAIIVVNDIGRHGAGWARREALRQVRTTRFAWLDSDDFWYPNHLADLNQVMDEVPDCRYVYSWFDGPDPLGHFGIPFNPCTPHHTTITCLIDTALAKEVGYQDNESGPFANEDWNFILGFSALCCERGYKMTHLAKRTWFYEQHGQNSSGKPGQGDAR